MYLTHGVKDLTVVCSVSHLLGASESFKLKVEINSEFLSVSLVSVWFIFTVMCKVPHGVNFQRREQTRRFYPDRLCEVCQTFFQYQAAVLRKHGFVQIINAKLCDDNAHDISPARCQP